MHYSFLNHTNVGNLFKNKDIISFKQQQIQNLKRIEHFLMENNSNTTDYDTDESTNIEVPDTNVNIVLQENTETVDEQYNPNNRFNVNRMMRLNNTYDAYKGSEIKVNDPPVAPYPFGRS